MKPISKLSLVFLSIFCFGCHSDQGRNNVSTTTNEDLSVENDRLRNIQKAVFKFEGLSYPNVVLRDSVSLLQIATPETLFIRFTEVQCLTCIEQLAVSINETSTSGMEIVFLASYESERVLSLYLKRLGLERFTFFNIKGGELSSEIETLNLPYIFRLIDGKLTGLWFPHYSLEDLSKSYIESFANM